MKTKTVKNIMEITRTVRHLPRSKGGPTIPMVQSSDYAFSMQNSEHATFTVKALRSILP